MKITMKLKSEDWIFSRLFSYADGQRVPYRYQTIFFKKNLNHEPKPNDEIPYIIMDELGIMINQNNKAGDWIKWDWEKTRSVRVYELLYPWKASIFQWMHECDYYKQRKRERRYFKHMNRKYKLFSYSFKDEWKGEISIIFEGKNGNAQMWIPSQWIANGNFQWFMDNLEKLSEKEIKYFNTEDRWVDKWN